MSQDMHKRQAAEAALAYVKDGAVVGVGTGSTVMHFIDLLAARRQRITGAVSSSEASTERLVHHDIPVLDLNDTGALPLYVDGADESNPHLELIKGGGGALTREKIIAGASEVFVCIADRSKLVDTLGTFPLPVEVIPMARALVARRLAERGARAEWREGFVTDNGNHILDAHGLTITDPKTLESELSGLPGVVTVGLFAHRPADVLILGGPEGVEERHAPE